MGVLGDERLLWFVNRSTGVMLLVLMTLSVVFGVLATLRTTARWWPRFATQALHRNISLLAVALLVAHALTAVVDNYVDIDLIDIVVPWGMGYRPLWGSLGTLSLDLTVIAVLTSFARRRFGLRTWRAVHLTTYAAWLAGLVHGLGIGTDQREAWSVILTAVCVGLVAGAATVRLSSRTREPDFERVR